MAIARCIGPLEDVRLHAEVVADDVKFCKLCVKLIRLLARHLRGVVLAVEALPCAGFLDGLFLAQRRGDAEYAERFRAAFGRGQ